MEINPNKLIENIKKPTFKVAFSEDADKAINRIIEDSKEHPLSYDVWIYRIVVFVLGASLLTMVFYLCQQLGKKEVVIPDVFISIISAIVGAIAGLLAPSPNQNNKPQS